MNGHVFLRDVKNWPQLEPRQFSAVFRVVMASLGSWMELPGNSPLKGPLISAEKSTQKHHADEASRFTQVPHSL